MSYKLAYSTLRWQNPDLEPALNKLIANKLESGWQGWESRLPLNWMGTPSRLRRTCADAGMEIPHELQARLQYLALAES